MKMIDVSIKRYISLLVILLLAFIVNSTINPFIIGNSFDKKKDNKNYRVKIAELSSDKLGEISGIAYSEQNEMFWLHNDSGNTSEIYAADSDGDIKIIVELKDIENIDFEDIALQTIDNKHFIYIADVGNNKLNRKEMYIYRFKEIVDDDKDDAVNKVKRISLSPDILVLDTWDLNVNFEAMMVENKTGKIFLVEKIKDKKAKIYMISKYDIDENTTFPSYFGEIDFGIYGKQEVVALDISKDDKNIIIKTKTNIFMVKREDFKKNIASDKLIQLPYVEEYQGEAISWSSEALGYYTISEKKNNKPLNIYFYRNVYK